MGDISAIDTAFMYIEQFTPSLGGYDKSTMMRLWLGSDLGHVIRGFTRGAAGNGCKSNGPNSAPSVISFVIYCFICSGYAIANG